MRKLLGFNYREALRRLRPEILAQLRGPLLPVERAAAEARLRAVEQLIITQPHGPTLATAKRYLELLDERDRLLAALDGASDR